PGRTKREARPDHQPRPTVHYVNRRTGHPAGSLLCSSRGIGAGGGGGAGFVLLQPRRQLGLLLFAQVNTTGDALDGLFLIAFGTRHGVLLEELLHLVALFGVAKIARRGEENIHPAQASTAFFADLVVV